jgi:hypothetical protein
MRLKRAIAIRQATRPAGPCSTCYWRAGRRCTAHHLPIEGAIVAVGCASHQGSAPLLDEGHKRRPSHV